VHTLFTCISRAASIGALLFVTNCRPQAAAAEPTDEVVAEPVAGEVLLMSESLWTAAEVTADAPPADEPACPPPAKPKPNPCAAAYKPLYYDNDFGYLNDPTYGGHCFGDCWKLMPVGACGQYGTIDVGGQLRLRYHHEIGMGQDISGPGTLRFEDTAHDFLLTRLRLYGNWRASDHARVYVEGILADVTDDDGTYLPRPIDVNHGDFLNAFVDFAPDDCCTLRVGRSPI
jgi:hypothetical protein